MWTDDPEAPAPVVAGGVMTATYASVDELLSVGEELARAARSASGVRPGRRRRADRRHPSCVAAGIRWRDSRFCHSRAQSSGVAPAPRLGCEPRSGAVTDRSGSWCAPRATRHRSRRRRSTSLGLPASDIVGGIHAWRDGRSAGRCRAEPRSRRGRRHASRHEMNVRSRLPPGADSRQDCPKPVCPVQCLPIAKRGGPHDRVPLHRQDVR